MTKSIDRKLKVGDWIKPFNKTGTNAKYRNVTKRNINCLNKDYKDHYIFVEGNEIKKAEDYLKALMNIKAGDWIKVVNGEIDRIIKTPKIENPLEIDSYSGSVNTERNIAGSWEWLYNCPDSKVSIETAKEYNRNMVAIHRNLISFYLNRLKEFGD
jgi:hypothetical protein